MQRCDCITFQSHNRFSKQLFTRTLSATHSHIANKREIGESQVFFFQISISAPCEEDGGCDNPIKFNFIQIYYIINHPTMDPISRQTPNQSVTIREFAQISVVGNRIPIPSFYEIFQNLQNFPATLHAVRRKCQTGEITVINDSILIYTIKFPKKKTNRRRRRLRKASGQPRSAVPENPDGNKFPTGGWI